MLEGGCEGGGGGAVSVCVCVWVGGGGDERWGRVGGGFL